MDTLRDGLLRVVDDITFVLRNAGQTFAFLSDGRDMVSLAEAETGLLGTFSDHSDEGWPGFEFPLPAGARFHQATESVLTRCAVFMVHDDLDSLREFARAVGLEGEMNGLEFCADLAGGAKLSARQARHGRAEARKVITVVAVRQQREPDAIRAAFVGRGSSGGGPS